MRQSGKNVRLGTHKYVRELDQLYDEMMTTVTLFEQYKLSKIAIIIL